MDFTIACMNLGGDNSARPDVDEQGAAIAHYMQDWNADLVLVQVRVQLQPRQLLPV